MRTQPIPTLATAGLLAALALPCAALAAPVAQIGQAVSWELDQPGSLTWQIRLDAGHDYAVSETAEGLGGHLAVRDPRGRVLAGYDFNNDEEFTTGAEFRAPVSAYYFVTVATTQAVPPDQQSPGAFTVAPDCLASPASRCVLPVGGKRLQRPFNYTQDSDWYGTTLHAGRNYRAVLVAPNQGAGLQVRDAGGRVVVPASADASDGSLDFTVPRDGGYFVEVAQDADVPLRPYNLTLAVR